MEQASVKYRVSISKEDTIPGYLFSSLIERLGLICNFAESDFRFSNVSFFVRNGNIPKNLIVGFKLKTRRYDL